MKKAVYHITYALLSLYVIISILELDAYFLIKFAIVLPVAVLLFILWLAIYFIIFAVEETFYPNDDED